MFFSYDKNVSNLYNQCKRKLETIQIIDPNKLFLMLTFPIYWNKYSNDTKRRILTDVILNLLDKGIIKIIGNGEDARIESLLYDDNVFTPKFKR